MVNKPSKLVKEIVVKRKEPERARKQASVDLSIDVDKIPENSLTRLKDGLCVIFGIEKYKYTVKAPYANRDAAIFYEYAKSVFGIPEDHIYIRTNKGATKGEFEKVFGENGWIAKRITKGKTDVIIFFSGHGASDIQAKKQYLIPYDIDPNYASTAYPLGRIYKNLSQLGARSVTIFLDACFTGISREEEPLFAMAKPVHLRFESPLAYGNITVFTAASSEQIASAYEKKKHGLFTYYLLKGLQGFGDLNKDKEIKIGELFEYIRKEVKKEAGFMDREQEPEFWGKDKERVLLRLK
jgi:hypothetical protein